MTDDAGRGSSWIHQPVIWRQYINTIAVIFPVFIPLNETNTSLSAHDRRRWKSGCLRDAIQRAATRSYRYNILIHCLLYLQCSSPWMIPTLAWVHMTDGTGRGCGCLTEAIQTDATWSYCYSILIHCLVCLQYLSRWMRHTLVWVHMHDKRRWKRLWVLKKRHSKRHCYNMIVTLPFVFPVFIPLNEIYTSLSTHDRRRWKRLWVLKRCHSERHCLVISLQYSYNIAFYICSIHPPEWYLH